MTRKKTNYMTQATVLHSKVVRERDGRCLAVGAYDVDCSGVLQCAHIFGRGELSIRTLEDNAVTLCAAHHRYFTGRPAAWEMWVRGSMPGRWERLRGLVHAWYEAGCPKVDWQAERDRLKAKVAA